MSIICYKMHLKHDLQIREKHEYSGMVFSETILTLAGTTYVFILGRYIVVYV